MKPVCRCGHSATFDPHGLWWLFECRGWDDRLGMAKVRFWCRLCRAERNKKVHPLMLDTVAGSDSDLLFQWPPESEWKRALNRAR